MPAALEAAAALAPEGDAKVRAYSERMLAEAFGAFEVFEAVAPVAPAAVRTGAGRPAAAARVAGDDGDYQYVGIVMAKSAEGDAVARFFAGRADVLEQPAFWEIRARDRLVIPYDEVSEELGYHIDAYSIQHEMSTHYGRMVATDDALMLFSDPTEAMEYLLS
jgi:propane monooxygenase coupling protein